MSKPPAILILIFFLILTSTVIGFTQNEDRNLLPYAYEDQLSDLKVEIGKIIKFDTEIDYKKTPGFIVGVIDGNQQYVMSFGNKSKDKSQVLAINDVFELGSLTKSMTADIISVLVSKNLLKYEDKINQYLPEEYRNPRLEHITIIDLLNHKSSLPKLPKGFGKKEKYLQNPYANYTKLDLLKYYRDFLPDDFEFRYSHVNYAMLEIIIEQVTEDSYEDVLDEYLLDSLNLEDTFVDFKEQKNQVTTPGYDRSKKMVGPWIFASFKGSEGVKSSMNDLLNYTYFHLDQKKKYSLKDWSKNDLNAKQSFNSQLYQDLGWHFVMMGSNIVTINTGFTSGHTAFIGRVDVLGKAVVILANSSIGVGDLGLQILRMISNSDFKIK